MSKYLKIGETARKADEAASLTTNTTKAADTPAGCEETRYDINDKYDKRVSFTPLTVSEALREINRFGSGAGRNAELYRKGELSEESAVEYVTCAILQRRGESFEVWKHHAPAVRKALGYCIHELPPEDCKVCNGYVKSLIEKGGA